MSAILSEYDRVFDVRRFPPGHAVQACDGVERRARPLGYADLLRLLAVAKASSMNYIALKARRHAQKLSRGEGRTRPIDALVDSNFGQIHDLLSREAATYADEPSGKLAAELLEVVFPHGLAAVTRIAYEEQVALNEYQVALIREKYHDAPALLGFERQLGRIEALLPEYRDSLDLPDGVSAIAVGEAYAEMQVALLRVVAWIMAMVEDADRRAMLMAPVYDQEARLAAAYAARRRGQSAPEDVPLDDLDLDAEARAALDEAAAAEAAAQAEAEAAAQAEAGAPDAAPEAAREAEAEVGAPEADGQADRDVDVDAEPGERRPLGPIR